MASPVKRDAAAAAVSKEKDTLTEADLFELKDELKKEMPEAEAERAVEIVKQLNSNDTKPEDSLAALVSLHSVSSILQKIIIIY